MEATIDIMKEVQQEIYIKYGWKTVITKGGYLVINIQFELCDLFEIECKLQDVLEEMSLELDIHFCYDFYEDKIKVYALV